MKHRKLLVPLLVILVACLALSNLIIAFDEESEYTFDEDSCFVPGKWDAQKGRVNTVVTEDGEELTFKVIDKQPTQSRAYSEALDITLDTKISFRIEDMGIGAGFSLSFLATDDDYPMHIYGDGFRVLFKDTQTSLVASTTVHSRADDIPDDFIGNGGYTIVDGTDYLAHTYTVKITDYNYKDSTVIVSLDKDGENIDSFAVNFDDLSGSFDPEACYLLLTPEIDQGIETSWGKPVKVLLTDYLINGDWVNTVPTEVPTEAATEAPTEAATEAATEAPTEVSTETPTEVPTDAPVVSEEPKTTSDSKSNDNTPKKNSGWLIPVIICGVVLVAAVAIIAVVSKNKKKKA